MSLIPLVLRSLRPSRNIIEQQFKMMQQMDAIMSSFPRPILWSDPWFENDVNNNVVERKIKNEPFALKLNLKHFRPEEITVKTVDSNVIIEGMHEEEVNDNGKGFVSRHFLRTYRLPEGHLPEDVVSNFSTDGVLTVTAPNKAIAAKPEAENEKVENENES